MASEMYITAFSKLSNDEYPTNIYSNFSYSLPVPLNLSLDSEWVVGVVNLYHSPVFGIANEKQNDKVIFHSLNNDEKVQVKSFSEFIKLMSEAIASPLIYTREYFDDFYNLSNLKNFKTNTAIQKHKCEPSTSTKVLKINSWGIASGLRKTGDPLYDHIFPDNIIFELNRQYTLNQIVYTIVQQCVDHIETEGFTVDGSGKKIKNDAYHKNRIQVHDHLLNVVRTVVQELAREQKRVFIEYYKSGKANKIHGMFLHADIAAPQNFNKTLARVAYISTTKEFHYNLGQIVNVSYVPVVKNYIDEISFKFTDQNNNLILFMNENKETFIRLHFKQKSI